MSAIAGIYFLDGRSVELADLERMVDNLTHRGVDGVGIWNQGSVGFGHRMLWTTPESLKERLPLTSTCGSLVLTADARIDNRDELMIALGVDRSRPGEVADSELILRAYERWGERCPQELLGDFAFAIWDGRRQVVFCARDPMGVKPFYYYRSDRAFVFGSEIKAFFCLQEVPRCLNETRVADFLVSALEDPTATFYSQIFRLPPGHCMAMGREQAPPRPYWSLDLSRELRLRSDDEYAEAFREIFAAAVSCRLRSAFPLGSMLSGGLDSSSVVCMARERLKRDGTHQLHTFSAVFDDEEVRQCDERPFINAVLGLGGLKSHFVRADQLSPLGDREWLFWHQDEPPYVPNLFWTLALYRIAQQQGVRVILDGHDGDTTVSLGLDFLPELAQTGQWIKLAREVTALSRNGSLVWSPAKILLQYALRPLTPEPVRRLRRLSRGNNAEPWGVNPTIHPDFARRIGLADRMVALQRPESKPAWTARQHHWLALTSGLIPYINEVIDKTTAALSVEARHPFWDRRLVEFCLALPSEQKLNQGWFRIVMRRAMAGILPEKVRWRAGKTRLGANFRRSLLKFEQPLLEKVIFEDAVLIEQYVDLHALRQAYRRYADGRSASDALLVWAAVNLTLWLRQTTLVPHSAQGEEA
jgi:asparagine synthase (glutamine-hydrolysing)